MLEIHLLGQYTLQLDGTPIDIPSRPARTLLAYLLLTRGTHHPREKLGGLLWPDSSETNARKNLRQALWQLRKAIGDAHLLADTVSIAFNTASDFWLDVSVLENPTGGDLEKEVSVYEGELLPGFYEDWVLLARDRLNAIFERKMQLLLTDLTNEHRWPETVDMAERWIAQGHVPESAYRTLMIAHAATGERSKIEAVYKRCNEALLQEIGVEPSDETMGLYRNLLAGEQLPQPLEISKEIISTTTPQVNLPAQTTPFIGRKAELIEIKRQFSTTRLLTLIGPGGIGKTRLALKAAAQIANKFENGCFFVSLAPITEVKYLIQTIAEGVKSPLAGHKDPQEQLLTYLQHKQLLLVVDNFEHLLEGAEIINEILLSAPGVKILVTSHERLNLQSETTLIIGGMGFPGQLGAETIDDQDAISLFIQSASKVCPGFDPTTDELEQIAMICELVGGMPLAIELAAAWLNILTIEDISDELEKGLDILTTELRDTPERHRSIRAVFNHSWFLLEPIEQETFLPLSIFRGGFTLEAAQQVTGASLQLISALVNKSFLSRDPNKGRFEIHELLRQYAKAQLEENPQASMSAQEAHAAYYAAFIQRKGADLRGKRQALALNEIEADIENVRSAWRYYLAQKNSSQLWKFITGIWHLYWIRWWNLAGMELFADAVTALEGEQDNEAIELRALAMACQGYFMAWLGLAEQGYDLAMEGARILQRGDRREALVLAYDSLIVNAYFLGHMREDKAATNRMYEIALELDDKWLLAFGLFPMSMLALIEGDYTEAGRLSKTNLALYEELGDLSGSTMPLIVMGHVALANNELEQARESYLRCLQISEEVGFFYSIQTATKYLAKVAIALADITEAEIYLIKSLRITEEIGYTRDLVNLMYEYARLRVAQGELEGAVELLALVIQHPESHQTRLFEGQIRDSAKDLLGDLENTLPQEIFASAMERGKQLELDEFVAELIDADQS